MIKRIKSNKIVTPDGITKGYIYVEDGIITEISERDGKYDEQIDATCSTVIPGFVEIHTHGAGGYPFLTEDEHVVARACDYHLKHGTTTILPTLSASPIDVMERSAAAIKRARDNSLTKARIVGAHLEGPYLSAGQCGAQCTDFITSPKPDDYTALVDRLGDAIARWTYAPENDKDGRFADYNVNNGVLLSAGHTDAKYPDIDNAISHGCKLITHLYSCTSTVTRNMGFRSLGVIESAFLRDELNVEIIADGKHLPKELVQMIVKIKGTDRVILISDSLEIAGTDITEGVMAGTPFIVEDGVCKLRDRSAFAGSVATSDRLLRFITEDCGFSLVDGVKMACDNPARLLGLKRGRLEAGYDADIVLLDEQLFVTGVMFGVKKII